MRFAHDAIRRSFLHLRLHRAGLQIHHLAISPAGLHQFFMPALLDDVAIFQHQNPAGVGDGAEPVGDHKTGAALHQSLHAALDQPLGFGVEIAGGFIENQDARVGQDRPGDGDSLALPAGEFHAALADQRVVSVWPVSR